MKSNESNPLESVREIFLRALEKPSAVERNAFLDGACGTNLNLRAKVNELLENHLQDSFLERSPIENEATLNEPTLLTEAEGTQIDRYKLLQQIGEGGMGVVFMADQEEPVRRKVALKIIKLGMDTKSVVARFEAERQALALMDHPNIAKVLDAGSTETGRPYFVMELVKGVPINTYCDKNQLSTRDRLELFTQVCKSIQHAHQKGVIHRDIKPSNILVTLHDGKSVPKVIDFGIAKATNQRLTEKTLFTNFAQMIGTPAYMSPEQAELSGLDVDTRTDVYSLGVLLYELLTGSTPFPEKELLSQGYGEMQRIIAEQEPDRPSLRMSTLEGEAQSIVSKNRSENPSLLTRQLRGDLDWIVMKALEKDRTRRYETANGLAEDICRHLKDEPVSAARPSLHYRFFKIVRRNRPAFAAGVAFVLVLIISSFVSIRAAMRAQRSEETAVALNEFLYEGLIAQGNPANSSQRSLTLFDALESLEERIPEHFSDRPELEVQARLTIGRAYVHRLDSQKSDQHLERAYTLCQEIYGPNAPETVEAGRAYVMGWFYWRRWTPEISEIAAWLYEQSRRIYGSDDPRRYLCHAIEAKRLYWLGEFDKGLEVMQEAQRYHEVVRAYDPIVATINFAMIGQALERKGAYAEAEPIYRRAVQEFGDFAGNSYPAALFTRSWIGFMALRDGDLMKAESELETILAVGKGVFMDASFMTRISGALLHIYFVRGEEKKAESLARSVLSDGASEFDVQDFLYAELYLNAERYTTHEEAKATGIWERARQGLLDLLPLITDDLPKKNEVLYQIARCYYAEGNREGYYRALGGDVPAGTGQVVTHRGLSHNLNLRAMNRAALGKWKDARVEIQAALDADPAYFHGQVIAAQVDFNLGDEASWAERCALLIDGFNPRHHWTAGRLLLTCLGQRRSLPDDLERRAIHTAEESFKGWDTQESARGQAWRIVAGGLAAWRKGELEKAVERLDAWPYETERLPFYNRFSWERYRWRSEGVQHLLLANCYAQLDRGEEAREHLQRARETLDRISYDWWEPVLLEGLREDTIAAIEAIRE